MSDLLLDRLTRAARAGSVRFESVRPPRLCPRRMKTDLHSGRMPPETIGPHDDQLDHRAREWIIGRLDHAGLRCVGEMGEPRVRPWSIVIRVPTDDGAVWFKANRAQTTYEPALINVLARRAPEVVLTPIATDVERGWSLLPDGGPILRSFPTNTCSNTGSGCSRRTPTCR